MPLLYDHREARSGIPGVLALAGVKLQAQQLPVGDYVLSDRLIVERKTGADLVASIKDRRLFDQLARLRDAYPQVVLIVEGRPERFPEAGWKGALGSALRAGVALLQTEDFHETAEWIERLARQEGKAASGPRGAARQRKALDPDRLAEQVAEMLPGVSTVGARRLLEHFGSLHALFSADEAELRQVRGFGKQRAAALAVLFAGRYGESPLRS